MNDKLKKIPWGVKVAAVFLLLVYVAMCFVVPWVGMGLTVGLGTILSIMRLAHYFQYED